MGSQIYTRKGDKGSTALVDGSRVGKDSGRVEAYGTVDELNSWVGAARAFADDELLDQTLTFLQNRLYNCSSNLATPPDQGIEPPGIEQADVEFLEQAIDRFEQITGGISRFIVPGGNRTAGLLHVARTVCRRAERRIVALSGEATVDPLVQKFVNRASDFLFAAARYANAAASDDDVFWNPTFPRPAL